MKDTQDFRFNWLSRDADLSRNGPSPFTVRPKEKSKKRRRNSRKPLVLEPGQTKMTPEQAAIAGITVNAKPGIIEPVKHKAEVVAPWFIKDWDEYVLYMTGMPTKIALQDMLKGRGKGVGGIIPNSRLSQDAIDAIANMLYSNS